MGQTEERKQVYFKSDFAEVFDFKDVLGREIPSLSGLDFKIEFWVNDGDCDFGIPYTGKKYIVGRNASGKKGVMVLDDGRVAVAFDRHLLPPGKLWGEITVRRVDSLYSDGYQDVAVKFNTGIELTTDAGCATDMAEMAVLLPFIKGKWEDLTPEEIAELQRPATEAAENIRRDMTALEKTLNENEKVRIENEAVRQREENTRRESESVRTAHESERQTAERGRQTAETERGKQEDIRVSNENARIEAENKRAETFSGWKTELDSKAGREELSNIVGVPAEEEIEDLEPGIMATLLRTVPQVLTPEEQAQVKANLAISKMELFDDMWREAVGVSGGIDHSHYDSEVNKPYNINKLWFTYEEAVTVYHESYIRPYPRATFESCKSRTLLPLFMWYGQPSNSKFLGCRELEILGVSTASSFAPTDISRTFENCVKLRRIETLTYFNYIAGGDTCFKNCIELEYVNFGYMRCDLNLQWSPKLTLEMMAKLTTSNSDIPASGITITVHPDVYAKLTDAGNAEWHKVLTDAADKNITFATV